MTGIITFCENIYAFSCNIPQNKYAWSTYILFLISSSLPMKILCHEQREPYLIVHHQNHRGHVVLPNETIFHYAANESTVEVSIPKENPFKQQVISFYLDCLGELSEKSETDTLITYVWEI